MGVQSDFDPHEGKKNLNITSKTKSIERFSHLINGFGKAATIE